MTTNRIRLYLVAAAVLGVGALSASMPAGPGDSPLATEESELRLRLAASSSAGEALHILDALERIEGDRRSSAAWELMSQEERQEVIASAAEEADEFAREPVESGDISAQPGPRPFLGIWDGSHVPAPFRGAEFQVLNYWGGDFEGQPIGVYAGFHPANPEQGVIAITSGSESFRYRFLQTPTATGPVRIVAVIGGTIQLVSVRGTFQGLPGSGSSGLLSTVGGERYHFDLRDGGF